MIVIYEQDYDLVSIQDVIKDKQLLNYVDYYRNRLLAEKNVVDIVHEQCDDTSWSFKLKIESRPKLYVEEWVHFYFERFDKFNNFKK